MKTRYLFFVILFLTACTQAPKKSSDPTILSPADFETKYQNTQHALLMDVCSPAEYQQRHIEGAINIDFNAEDFKDKVEKLDKTQPVFMYCFAGSRSKKALAMMQQMGFKEVYQLKGGLKNWIAEEKPVVK